MSSKPRILHIAPNGREAGGLERFTALRARRDNRYEHHLLALTPIDPDYARAFASAASLTARPLSAGLIEKHLDRPRPECIIVYNRLDALACLAALDSSKALPVIFSIHDYSVLSIGPGYNRLTLATGKPSFFYLPVERDFATRKLAFQTRKTLRKKLKALDAATAIECPSDSLRAAISRFSKREAFVVPPYCQNFSPTPSDATGRSLLFIGALTRGKGIRLMMKSLSQLSQPFQLTVIGRGYLEKELKAWAIKGHYDLRHIQQVSPEALTGYYRKATLVLIPSILESFGMVAMEAMAHSRTVAAYDVPGISDQITHGINGLLAKPFDRNAYARLIERALSDHRLRSKIEANAYEYAREHYADNKIEARFDRLMRRCHVHPAR